MKALADLITEFQIMCSAHSSGKNPIVKITLDTQLYNLLCREMSELSMYREQTSSAYVKRKTVFRGIEIHREEMTPSREREGDEG